MRQYPKYVPTPVKEHVTQIVTLIDELCSLYGQYSHDDGKKRDRLDLPPEIYAKYYDQFSEFTINWIAEKAHRHFVCNEQPNENPSNDLLRHKAILLKLVRASAMRDVYLTLDSELNDDEWRCLILFDFILVY